MVELTSGSASRGPSIFGVLSGIWAMVDFTTGKSKLEAQFVLRERIWNDWRWGGRALEASYRGRIAYARGETNDFAARMQRNGVCELLVRTMTGLIGVGWGGRTLIW